MVSQMQAQMQAMSDQSMGQDMVMQLGLAMHNQAMAMQVCRVSHTTLSFIVHVKYTAINLVGYSKVLVQFWIILAAHNALSGRRRPSQTRKTETKNALHGGESEKKAYYFDACWNRIKPLH
jgi:hypothetical protein